MSATSPPFTGVPFGRYIIRRRLARGGMGEVFLADQLGPLGPVRPVALKRMLPRVARDPRAAKMFLEEMATAAQLNHPNVATTYDFGEVDGVYFLAMEYVEGLSLRQLVETLGPLPVADALTITAEIASALDHAHNRRSPGGGSEPVVHRDVSPHNVMIASSGAVKLLDFGIARAEAAVLGGRVEGKLAYAAPEQLQGSPADRRSDLWALGVVLYEILSGVVPFAAADPVGMLEATRSGHRVPVGARRPEAARVGPIVDRAMLDDPDARWPSAEAFAAACRALAHELGATGAEGRAALVARAGGPRVVDTSIGARNAAAGGTGTGAGVGVDAVSSETEAASKSMAEAAARVRTAEVVAQARASEETTPVLPTTAPRRDPMLPLVRGTPLAAGAPSAAITRLSVPVGPVTSVGFGSGEEHTPPLQGLSGAGEERTVPLQALRLERTPAPRPRPRAIAWALAAGAIVVLVGVLAQVRGPDPRTPEPQPVPAVDTRERSAADTPASPEARPTAAPLASPDALDSPRSASVAATTIGASADPAVDEDTPPEPRRATPRPRPRPSPVRERRPRSEPAAVAPTGLGLLSVRTVPWSRVSVDGRELGQSPLVHAPTAAGQHTLVLTPGQGEAPARTLTVHIRAGEVTKVFVDFARDATRIEP